MNILAIGAHPDDIEFGCGGTLVKYARAGHNVFMYILTFGGYGGDPDTRKKEQTAASEFIGVSGLFFGEYKDTEIGGNRGIITKMDEIIRKTQPDIVFMNYHGDTHQDHRATVRAGVSATRHIGEVLFYEVPSSQGFEPDVFVDIRDVFEDKLKLLNIHSSQVDRTKVRDLTILESATACALFRGFKGRVKYAEGFKALRIKRKIQ